MKYIYEMGLRLLLFTIVTLAISGAVRGQDTPEEIIETFFAKIESDDMDTALDYLYATNPWMTQNGDAVKNLKTQIASLNDVSYVGEKYGYDLIVEKEISPDYKLYAYLIKYDRQPIRFTFQFYRPNDTWKLYSFKYDSSLGEELDEAAKLQILTKGYQ